MEELLTSMEASLEEDAANEKLAEKNHLTLVNDLESTLTSVKA